MKNIYLFLLFLLLTGCSSDEITKPDVKGENIHNEIPQQLKAVDKTKLNTAIQYTSKSYLDLLDSAFLVIVIQNPFSKQFTASIVLGKSLKLIRILCPVVADMK